MPVLPAFPPLAFVDLETTGGDPRLDRITEVAVVTLGDGVVTRWSRLVNPQTPIPPFIARLTGITDAMVAAAPTFAELAAELDQRLDGYLFVAHNARFDYGFLRHEFRRLGLAFRRDVLCTVKLSRRLYPAQHRHGLDHLIARHGLVVRDRHRALGDAQAICDFWQLAVTAFGPADVQALALELSARPALPPHLDADALDELPDTGGVYRFYGEDDQPLYVGRSRNLRARVLAHFARAPADGSASRLASLVRRVDWIECAGDLEAALCEARLIRTWRPTQQQASRRERACTWQLRDPGEGRIQPMLVPASAISDAGRTPCYGLFAHARSAHTALQALAREHRLCPATLGLEPVVAGAPCSARPLGSCNGACVGEETAAAHHQRLVAALTRLQLCAWPFAGPAVLVEGDCVHVIDCWRDCGAARDDATLATALTAPPAPFDRDLYRLLVRHVEQLRPLATARLPWSGHAG